MPDFLTELARKPLEAVVPTADDIVGVFGLCGRDAEAVWEAYELSRRSLGPVTAFIAAKMLVHCRGVLAEDPDHVFVIAERDGGPLGRSLRGLAPDLASTQFRSVGISRLAAEAATIDGERRGRVASEALAWLRPFRKLQHLVREPDIDGAFDRFNHHLEVNGVRGATTAIDFGITGNPLYHCHVLSTRNTTFHALLATHCADRETDPLWDRKRGILVQVDTASRTIGPPPNAGYPGWRWRSSLPYLPDDPNLTMASLAGALIWESTLAGPTETVRYIDADGRPRLELQDTLPDCDHINLNPTAVSDKYRPVLVRAAVRTAVQLGIHDYARDLTTAQLAPGQREHLLSHGHNRFIEEARNWITGSAPVDPQLGELWDSFAMRPGSFYRRLLRMGLHDRGIRPEQSAEVWRRLAQIPVNTGDTFARHRDFVARELARIDGESAQHNTRIGSTTAASWAMSSGNWAAGLRAVGQRRQTRPNEAGANWKLFYLGDVRTADKGLCKAFESSP